MDIRKLQRAIVDGLEDVKAQNIQVFNTEHLSPLFERVIVAAGASNRQTKALAASVRDAVKAAGLDVLRTEGEENGEWIIVDCGAAVTHIMQPSIRDYYRLEEIWGGKPVAIKLNTKTGGLVKASEGFDEDDDADEAPAPKKRARTVKATQAVDHDDETPARKAALKKPAARKAPAALPRAKTPAERSTSTRGPAKKVTAREAAATKPAGSQKGVAKPAPKTAAGKVSAAAKTRAGSTAARAGKAPVKVAAPVKKVVVSAHSSRNAGTAAKKTVAKKATTKAAVAKKVAARKG
jgi:ribosome-associated protein